MFPDFATPPSSEELAWLQATALLETSLPLSIEDDINSQSDRLSFSSMSLSDLSVPPSTSPLKSAFPVNARPEWIYRTPKLPRNLIAHSIPRNSRPSGRHPSSLSRSRSNASSRTEKSSMQDCDEISVSSTSFFSAIPHPRTRPDMSVPPLRSIPSGSQLTFTPPELTPTTPKKIPRLPHIETPSLSPAFDILSHSPASSRSDSPVTPVSFSSMCRTGRRRSYDVPPHRHRRCSHSAEMPRTASTQSSPSKSILTRTASVSTRASSNTVNKSVKFATIPTVHYATRAYWDMDVADTDSIDINIDSMDLDDDPFANYRSREGSLFESDDRSFVTQSRNTRPTTPAPMKQNSTRVKRLLRLARKSVNTPGSERPIISSPYALGSYPTNTFHADSSSSSLVNRPWTNSSLLFRRSSEAAGSTTSVVLNGLSSESLRHSKASGAASLRSVESTSSRTERFRTWLSRTVGWTPA